MTTYVLPTGKPGLLRYLDRLPASHQWRVTIEPYTKKRSLPQNSLFHALAGELAGLTGETPARMKDILKHELGLRVVSKMTGAEIPKPTSEYTTAEMADLCERIWVFAAEHGYLLKLPGEERYG